MTEVILRKSKVARLSWINHGKPLIILSGDYPTYQVGHNMDRGNSVRIYF